MLQSYGAVNFMPIFWTTL